ncbi:7TM domain-containing protein [Zavarzinella formosa]|uniref:7TM domain-containing protein n=1 Tax=Zavarzinella formosa TaxID=360055 RepID=UPI0002F32C08|nr:7TM domain-containing protein [Zavarzinella formosa]
MSRGVIVWLLAIGSVAAGVWVMNLRSGDGLPVWARVELLPPAEQELIEFLLLLPAAALLCAIVRNVLGFATFGTFAPALLGLAFRETDSPVGLFVLMIVLTFGWALRRGVAGLNLLQVPRSSVMLSLVSALLVLFVFWSNSQGRPLASALPFLPLVIVTGLVERFWAMEEEDGTGPAVNVMLTTLATAGVIFLLARWGVVRDLFRHHPEALMFVLAGQLLLGRYTGYRLTELYRFRNMTN